MKNKVFLSMMIFLSACASPPAYDIIPEIKFLSISRNIIDQLDTARVEFEFTDGDGDLGLERPDSVSCNICIFDSCYNTDWSLFLFDPRTGCQEHAMIPYLPAKGSTDAISGTFNYVLKRTCCRYPDNTGCYANPGYPYDTVRYSIQIKDRAGHLSNMLELPPIIVRCN